MMAQRVPLTMGQDIHSTDLTEACPRKVLLRHEQKIEPVATTALFRGVLAGKCLEYLHTGLSFEQVREGVAGIANEVVSELAAEGRVPSDSVEKNLGQICHTVCFVAGQYEKQLMPLLGQCKLIGTELACRLTLGDIEFASHMDLVLRDTNNVLGYGPDRLIIADWKFRQHVPTKAYLARYHQFYLYWLMAMQGSVQAYPEVDGWIDYKENAQMIWVHLPNLEPYKRKITRHDDEGNLREYAKGEDRPVSSILRDVNYKVECASQMCHDLTERVNMMRAGFFPKIADTVGCTVCDAREFCTRADTVELLENQ